MSEIAPGWEVFDERQGDWLVVRLRNAAPDHAFSDTPPVAERVFKLLQQYGSCHLVLEMGEVPLLCSYLIGQLVLLHKRVCSHEGRMRLCNLSPHNQEVLRLSRLDSRFPCYHSRQEAMAGT